MPDLYCLGKLTGEAVNERFADDVKSGLVEFREINIDLPENKALAEKFQASGSVLFFNSIKNGVDNMQDDANVWGLTGNTDEFKSYITKKVNTLLGREI
ncbi:MAG: nitrophenyl compound nitroreductase subunit ArsF family protein [Candidatus Staskawiczbacteria bacterium]|nr:nitrophenyl compound nitroreductase subunit ArsF family protein [Candidatus Staskawiczbacteria bacterium]